MPNPEPRSLLVAVDDVITDVIAYVGTVKVIDGHYDDASWADCHVTHCLDCFNPRKCTFKRRCAIIKCWAEPACPATFHACKAEEHRALTCPETVVACINFDYGCETRMTRKQLGPHLSHCPASAVHCSFRWVRKLANPPSLDYDESRDYHGPRDYAHRDQHPHGIACGTCSYSEGTDQGQPLEPTVTTSYGQQLGAALLKRDEQCFLRSFRDSHGNLFSRLGGKDRRRSTGAIPDPNPPHTIGDCGRVNRKNRVGPDRSMPCLPLAPELPGTPTSSSSSGSNDLNSPSPLTTRPLSASSSYFDYVLAGRANREGCSSKTRNINVPPRRRPLSFPPPRNYHLPSPPPSPFRVDGRKVSCLLIPTSVLDRILAGEPKSVLPVARTGVGTLVTSVPQDPSKHQMLTLVPHNDRNLPVRQNETEAEEVSANFSRYFTANPPPAGTEPLYETRIHSYARYLLKPESVHYFTCSQFVRRDGFASHYKDVHTEVQGHVDDWLVHHCPLRESAPTAASGPNPGCDFRVLRLEPATCPELDSSPGKILRPSLRSATPGDILYNFATDGLNFKPRLNSHDLPPPDVANGDVYNRPTLSHHISDLPFELLCCVAKHLDPFSLLNLALVSNKFLAVTRRLTTSRGIVLTVWRKVSSTYLPVHNPSIFTVDSNGIRRDRHASATSADSGPVMVPKTHWAVVEKKWIFPKSFTPIDDWKFHPTVSSGAISNHMKTCPYNDINIQTKPFTYTFHAEDNNVSTIGDNEDSTLQLNGGTRGIYKEFLKKVLAIITKDHHHLSSSP